LEEFEGRMNVKVRRQEKIEIAEKKDLRKRDLPGRFIAKMLYGQDNGNLKRNWQKWKSVSLKKKP